MKAKSLILIALTTLSLLFSACSNSANADKKSIIVYFSRTGNTQEVANTIQKLTGSDLFFVETAEAYPAGYQEVTVLAKEELTKNARPEIKGSVDNFNDYDVVFIGFPVWWGTYPMAIATFLERYDFDGKTVIPFATHGGGGIERGFSDIESATPTATHKTGLALNETKIKSAQKEIENWLNEVMSVK